MTPMLRDHTKISPPPRLAQTLEEVFAHPTAQYRGAPLWSWNNRLDQKQLLRQIDYFREMGFGGFHIHPRIGLATQYLGPQFMEIVRACAVKAAELGMFCRLYDEDRWPSGAAGGLVTKDPAFREKHLLLTRAPYGADTPVTRAPYGVETHKGSVADRHRESRLLWRYEVVLKEGLLHDYKRLEAGESPSLGGVLWYLYIETADASPWFNNQTYLDTLNPHAVQRFVEVTHERYAQVVGDFFGGTIPSIFTDEPQFARPHCLDAPEAEHDLCIPFTDDFFESYSEAYGQHLEDVLPELFWELSHGRPATTRYRYYDHLSERFASAFADTVGDWCGRHGIALTGHLMEESTLQRQMRAVGEAMRSYRSFHIPGIDMLCDWREYNTAKQAQSAARQYGRAGVMSELYGVTNWDFDFADHKRQGDWQAALGVTLRVPHLSWVSMAGEAKRDYPASIFYQSPWYKEYPLVEDHFARLNTVLTRGRPVVRVGVIHPIESFWLCYGPTPQTQTERSDREDRFDRLTEWLLFGLIDFDFISESLLPSLCPQQDGKSFHVGEMRYDVVIVPSLRTIRLTTLVRLEAFAACGGTVIFAGEIPQLVDAEPSTRAAELGAHCVRTAFDRDAIIQQLAVHKEIEAAGGNQEGSLLYQLREEDARRYAFVCNTDRDRDCSDVMIRFKGDWSVELWDTLNGDRRTLPSQRQEQWTAVRVDLPAHGSALFVLDRLREHVNVPSKVSWIRRSSIASPVPITLSEPNVLLLDQAQWRLNEEQWEPTEEVLRIDNLVRGRLGVPPRTAKAAQPWTEDRPPVTLGTLQLKFDISCKVAIADVRLVVEDIDQLEIHLNGRRVDARDEGWFVDEAIRMVRLPMLKTGGHQLTLTRPFLSRRGLEWCYLMGDFGVEVSGRRAEIVAPVRRLAFGDWCRQGLPFYGGNVTYHCMINGSNQASAVRVSGFKAPLLSVSLDDRPMGPIAFSPFRRELGVVSRGKHRLDITAYGNRINMFGCVHNVRKDLKCVDPPAWRTEGENWSYEYRLKRMGVLGGPEIEVVRSA